MVISPFSVLLFSLSLALLQPSYAYTPLSLESISDSKTIIQDQQGYIWIAGIHGLTRFNGSKSIHFSKNSREWPLPFTWINNISSHGNKFLVATENQGAWIFDPLTGQPRKLPVKTENSSIYDIVHHKGHYFMYSPAPYRLYKYSLNNQSTEVIAKDLLVTSLVRTQKNIFFSTENRLYKIENNIVKSIIDTPISSTATSLNTLFVATKNKIWAYKDNGKVVSITLSDNIMKLSTDHQKKALLAVMANGEIFKFDDDSLSPIEHSFEVIKPNYINHLFQDANSVLWITKNSGIQRVTEIAQKNHSYSYQNNQLKDSNLHITSLNDEVIIGTFGGGLYDFNGVNNLLPSKINKQFSSRGLKIMDILGHKSSVFVATFDGLWQYSLLTQELSKVDIFQENTILLSLQVEKDKLYIGTDQLGLVIYDLKAQSLVHKLDKKDGLSSSEVIDLLPLGSNTLWVATSKGINIYNSVSNKMSTVERVGASKVYSLAYADNKVFAATQSDGILVYNHQGILLSQFGQDIPFHSVKNINEEIWAPSIQGLYKIIPKTHKISLIENTEKYTFSDSPILLNDKIYIPHYKGVLEIPLHTEKTVNAKVYISKTTVSGNTYLHNTSIKLDSSNDVVLLEFASLDYRLGQAKQYQYQINSGQWNSISGDQLRLANLAPGTYRLNVRGTNSLGEWSNHHAFTEIQVAFPWYWTPQIKLVYLLTFLSIALITFWLLYLRFKSIKNIHNLLSEDILMRGKSSLNVSKSLLRVIDIVEGNRKEKTDNLFSETHNKQEICDILQECIAELSSHSEAQEPNALYGKSLSVALPYFIEFIHNKYHVTLTSKYDIDESMLSYELQSDIYKIIYEAITAALLKGSNGNFSVNIQEFKQKVWLTINDDEDTFTNYSNQINFDMSMYLIRQIAKKNNASVNTFHDKSKGSQLLISFPLMNIS